MMIDRNKDSSARAAHGDFENRQNDTVHTNIQKSSFSPRSKGIHKVTREVTYP